MPDTGAPWNIPYVAGTDLVRDWPTDSQELAEAIADGLDDAQHAGIGSNVVSVIKTDTFSQTVGRNTQTNAVVSATITPTSATSKILVIVTANVTSGSGDVPVMTVYRDASPATAFIGDAASSRRRTTSGIAGSVAVSAVSTSFVGLDAPATTSAVSYDIRFSHAATSATIFVNRGYTDTDDDRFSRQASSITLIEVKA